MKKPRIDVSRYTVQQIFFLEKVSAQKRMLLTLFSLYFRALLRLSLTVVAPHLSYNSLIQLPPFWSQLLDNFAGCKRVDVHCEPLQR